MQLVDKIYVSALGTFLFGLLRQISQRVNQKIALVENKLNV